LTTVVQQFNVVHLQFKEIEVADKRHEFRYVGPEHQLPPVKGDGSSALSPQNAITVIRSAWNDGRIYLGSHFKNRCNERGIDMLDVENLIGKGTVRANPEYCPINKNWKYQVTGLVDERHLEVVIALDPTVDYTNMPLAILITAYEKKAGQ
jgi:hypothetical protein